MYPVNFLGNRKYLFHMRRFIFLTHMALFYLSMNAASHMRRISFPPRKTDGLRIFLQINLIFV